MCSLAHVLGCAVSQPLYCSRGLLTAGSDQTAAVNNEQIGDIVRSVPAIDHARSRIVTHPTGAHQVARIFGLSASRVQPDLLATSCGQDLFLPLHQKLDSLHVIRMVL